MVTLAIVLFSAFTTAYAKNNMTLQQYGNDHTYDCTDFQVGNVQRNTQAGTITFVNVRNVDASTVPDTNIYLIDKDTDVPDQSIADLDDLKDGRWINIYVLRADLQGHPSGKIIHVAAVGGVNKNVVVYPGGQPLPSTTPTTAASAAPAPVPTVFSDVNTTSKYAYAAYRLSYLNIIGGYSDGTFKPDNQITRAEMAKIVCNADGLVGSPAITQTQTLFSDVLSTHWASGYVAMANSLLIINGNGDGTFSPDDSVTYEQAVKMIVSMLGYSPMAEMSGDYPNGYLAVAANIRLNNGVVGVSGQPVTRGTVALLVNNALDTPLMIQVGYGEQNTYQIQDGSAGTSLHTLITDKLGKDIPQNTASQNTPAQIK